MRELLPTLQNWFDAGHKVAMATVAKVYGSAPRSLGAKMVVNDAGMMAGSVSGGCVEGAVVAEALEIIKSQKPRLVGYGVSDELAFSVGLACGGIIEVFIEPLEPAMFKQMQVDLLAERLFARLLVLTGKDTGKSEFLFADQKDTSAKLSDMVPELPHEQIDELLRAQLPKRISFPKPEGKEVLIDIFNPRIRLFIVGAVHIAIPLVQYARVLGFYTIVIDPRKSFANPERFPMVDELVLQWPDEYLQKAGINEGSYIAVISHDEKLDIPGLTAACRSKAHYIGALGSKKTFAKNVAGLRENGISEEDIARIYSPIGISLGAHGPEEIALAIMAQVVAVKNGVPASR